MSRWEATPHPRARGRSTRLVDLKGAAVIPGLSDNHDHLYNSEKVMRGIDLVGATSTAEVSRRLRTASPRPSRETVFGSVGWRAPLRQDRSRSTFRPRSPSSLCRAGAGPLMFNTAALKKAGIAKDMQSYMGKAIPKDSSGELTGELPDFPAGTLRDRQGGAAAHRRNRKNR